MFQRLPSATSGLSWRCDMDRLPPFWFLVSAFVTAYLIANLLELVWESIAIVR